MTNEIATRTLGDSGLKILELAKELQVSISDQWNDEAIQRINQDGEQLIKMATELKAETPDDYEELKNFFLKISQYLKTGESYCKPFKEYAKKPHNLVCDIAKKFNDPGSEAKTIVMTKISDYRALERKREKEAERKAEYERQQEEKKKREAEEKKAEKALEKGNEAKADMHLQNAEEAYVPPAVVVPTVKKTETTSKGTISFIKDHKVQVMDKMAVIKTVAAGLLPATFLDVNEGAIKKWAKACGYTKYDQNGIHVWEFERPSPRTNFNRG